LNSGDIMPASEVFFLILALCLSVIYTGRFLHVGNRTTLLSALAAAIAGGAAFWFVPYALRMVGSPFAGFLLAALCTVMLDRRPAADGVLAFFIDACYFGLWVTFQSGLKTVYEAGIVFGLYCIFFLLHLPAVLVTFPKFSLPVDWRMRLQNKTGQGLRLRALHLLALGFVLLLMMNAAFPLITASNGFIAAAKIVLATALFWAGLTILVLLVAYSQKQEQSTAESDYHDNMATFMNVVRSQRHDYNLHVQTVASLIAQQKWDECRGYVNALTQDTAELNTILPVQDPAVAALIGNFKALAAQRGIVLQVDVRDDMACISTSTYETNKIIGNLLQNALDEMEQHPVQTGGRIELGIFKRGEYCLIRVSNKVMDKEAFAQNRENIFRQGYTTKQGHDGVGLSSMQALARQAGGDVSVWLENDTAHFIASIPMSHPAICDK
jgi:signal transduction histidine kinase